MNTEDRRGSSPPISGDAMPGERRPALAGALTLAMAVLCALVLVLPGQTVATKYLPELFAILDGAYRAASGQVPSVDFHTALGPLAHYLPALGLRLSGSLGGAVPIGTALFILLLAPAMAHVLGSRLRASLAVTLAAFLLLIVAVPITLGETVTSLSFARFYNRVGWAALATLLVLYLRPERRAAGQDILDGVAAALLVLVMLYTKAAFALVAAAFVAAMLLDPRQRRWAALALVVTAAAGLVAEAVWGGSAAYLSDLLRAWAVSGGVRGSAGQIADHLLRNLADFVLFGLFAGLALWRTRSPRDLLFYAFCAIAGFWLINQSFQTWGIISLYAGAAVAAERLMRSESAEADPDGERWRIGLGAPLFMLALVLPTVIHCLIALGLHAGVALVRGGEAPGLPAFRDIRLVHLWTWGEHDAATKYLATLQDGARALAEADPKPAQVFVLDAVSPFSAGLGLAPARGDSSWLLWGRTLDAANFVPPEQLLADVRVVMEPKLPSSEEAPEAVRAAEGLRQVYGPYVAQNFDLVRESAHWRVHLRRSR